MALHNRSQLDDQQICMLLLDRVHVFIKFITSQFQYSIPPLLRIIVLQIGGGVGLMGPGLKWPL